VTSAKLITAVFITPAFGTLAAAINKNVIDY
jgi:hypothetical protein